MAKDSCNASDASAWDGAPLKVPASHGSVACAAFTVQKTCAWTASRAAARCSCWCINYIYSHGGGGISSTAFFKPIIILRHHVRAAACKPPSVLKNARADVTRHHCVVQALGRKGPQINRHAQGRLCARDPSLCVKQSASVTMAVQVQQQTLYCIRLPPR